MKHILTIACILTFFNADSFCPSSNHTSYQLKTIVIDAGHGGKDPGTLGRISKEKDINLAVALELGRILKSNFPAVKVVYTRSTDKFVELYKRAEIAHKNQADLFISLHCNAMPRNAPNRHLKQGTITYVMGLHKSKENLEVAKRENEVIYHEENYESNYEGFDPDSPQSYILLSLSQQVHLQNSLNLANKIQSQFQHRVKRKNLGVRQAGFVVLAKTATPSVLIELGFLSSPTEEKFLNDSLNQVYMASAIFRAIRDYKEEVE